MLERVHRELKEVFAAMPVPEKPTTPDTIAQSRKNAKDMMAKMGYGAVSSDTLKISQEMIPGANGDPNILVYIFQPVGMKKAHPGILYLHGGGMTTGGPDLEGQFSASIAERLQCTIISPDYRLAPENPYPAALNDCYTTLNWLYDNAERFGVDRSRIALIGGSAGGGLAAATALTARDRKGPAIAFQCLLCPMIDDRHITPSSEEITDMRVWCRARSMASWDMYLGGDRSGPISPYAAPARAEDLSGLPPTFLSVGQLDPIRDETIAYAQKLYQAGIDTELHVYPGCFHGFEGTAPQAEICKQAMADRLRALNAALN